MLLVPLIMQGQDASETNLLNSASELKRLSLDQLLNLQVTTVSREPEPASRAAAAVEVITQDEMDRSGATSVPDALRLATGVQVSRFSGSSYAVGMRGFTSLASDKLQVMQDGRSLYSPLFSGVFWDAYDTMLQDVDRIEVVRGPGATMWGANAVNGVINIITKDARDTQGVLAAATGGTEERAMGGVRYGDKIGDSTYFRVYGQYQQRDSLLFPNGADARDGTQDALGGFRMDSYPTDQNHFTLQGDYNYDDFGLSPGGLALNRSGNVLGRWTQEFNDDSELQVQSYYDRFERQVPGQFGEHRNTFDVDSQYRRNFGERNAVIAGLEYRISADNTVPGGTIQFNPPGDTIHIFSAFVQDEITLVPSRLALVLGTKLEWDSLDGVEPQPNVRLAWTPTDHQTVWAAFSRAVRMPTRFDDDLRFIPNPATGLVTIRGNPNFEPEKVYAYELGYRIQPVSKVSVDLATYYNKYVDLRSLEPTPPAGLPLVEDNRLDAETYGVELSLKYQAASWWRLSGNYTWLHKNLLPQPGSHDPTGGTLEGNDAPNLFSLWSSMDLPHRVTFDAMLRYVDSLPNPAVPSYVELDLRLAWRPVKNVELAIVGQNLIHAQHLEWGAATPTAAEVQRGVYGRVTWRF